ncbi:alcohol oxidase-like protein [Hypoxylon trugodes]|uniref:alcohol oxidase-like protein n=1 Tax=Hypoxylon trugodes TaxID=326681 RepID=UPI0021987DD9|nr:alcohol oxidase-like protein [Hypoxylon trugodes]KAI1383549.1 alcohol oxidase-like protein [Hypoxylon trugodes]
MGLYTELPKDIEEVDVIIAGGGTAGCVIAARLAEADPQLFILVVEGGPNNLNEPSIIFPVFFLSHLLSDSKNTIFNRGNKTKHVADREIIIPTGGVLGGGSSINYLKYVRAQRMDFDAWDTPGWTAEDMLYYMKKFETYYGPGKDELHGKTGPIHVSSGTFRPERTGKDFIAAASKLGLPEFEDIDDLDSNEGVGIALRYISPDGVRQDTAHRYLHPKLQSGQYPNLHVVVESQVLKVLIENKKAVGVTYQPKRDPNGLRTVKARRLVVVSCGALGSPLVLERSGIGHSEVLKKAGVEIVEDLPGVGQDYQDHQILVYPYRSSLAPEETMDDVIGRRVDPAELIKNKAPVLGWNAQDLTCKVRPTEAEVAALGPKFQAAWEADFKNNSNKPLTIISPTGCYPGDPTGVPVGQYVGTATFSTYPYSRGHMHITGPTLSDPPDFDTGFLSDPEGLDIKTHVWAYKKQRELLRRMNIFRGELISRHPPFPAGSRAACIEIDAPLTDVRDIEYSAEDDAILEQWIREHVDSVWHGLGTCKMAPRDKAGVVDANLGVYGIEGLKVADLGIVPTNVAANTNSVVLAIGEKAADIFIKELGLSK